MKRGSPVWAKPMTPVTSGTAVRPAVAVVIPAWKSEDLALAPGTSERKSATTELLPAPYLVSRRADTPADSELASSQPPDDRADEAWLASVVLAIATTTAMRATGRRKR
jgi:hypothetical protein